LRHTALALVASVLCAYGYGQEQDPFIAAWKLVASHANQGRWAEARESSRDGPACGDRGRLRLAPMHRSPSRSRDTQPTRTS
jgi:hypothetical protein